MTDADLARTLNAALHSPDFALRLLSQSPSRERAELLRRWTQLAGSRSGAATDSPPPSAQPKPAAPPAPLSPTSPFSPASPLQRPGLRKCGTSQHVTQSRDLALQLAAFARSVGRVG